MEPHAEEDGQKNEEEDQKAQRCSKTDQNFYNKKSIPCEKRKRKGSELVLISPQEGSSQVTFDDRVDLDVNEPVIILDLVSSRHSV